MAEKKEFKCEINKDFGELSTNGPRLRIVKYGDYNPKFDIRKWTEEDKPLKGVTLTFEELDELKRILNKLDLNDIDMDECDYGYEDLDC